MFVGPEVVVGSTNNHPPEFSWLEPRLMLSAGAAESESLLVGALWADGWTDRAAVQQPLPAANNLLLTRMRDLVGDDGRGSGYVGSGSQQELASPVLAPIYHQPMFLGEAELFGYSPLFQPNSVSFDLQNRPYLRTQGQSGLTYQGWVETIVGGAWVAYDFVASIRAALPEFTGPFREGPGAEQRIVFDTDGDAYMAVETPDYTLLLHSRDGCRTWGVYRLADPHVKFEFQDGNNVLDGPPVILSYGEYSAATTLRLTVPTKNPDGTLTIPPPIVISQTAFGVTNQHGAANAAVTVGSKTHIVWAGAEAVPGQPGTPQYAVTYDRQTGILGIPVLLGFGGTSSPDPHCLPSITADSQGYLHVILGAHNGQLKYLRSLRPNKVGSGWTEPELLGTTDPAADGRLTYVALICDAADTLHLVTRSISEWYHFDLVYLRKRPWQGWEEPQLLVHPFRRYYGTWHQKLGVDRQGRLFLSYMYSANEFSPEEAAAYMQKWPDEPITLAPGSSPLRGDYLGVLPHDPAMLVSDDGGQTWRLAVTEDFVAGLVIAPPDAQDLAIGTNEDTPVAGQVTASPDEPDPLTFRSSDPNVRMDPDGSFVYTPPADFNGTQTFLFVASNGFADSHPGMVTVTVTPVNDVPTADAQAVTTDQYTPFRITLTGSDRETAYADLVFAIVTAPAHGTLSAVAHGTYEYTPSPGYSGSDSLRFTITDTGDGAGADRDGPRTSSPAAVGVSVLAVVPIARDQNVTVPEDGSVEIALGADQAGPGISFSIVSPPEHGSLTQLSAGVYEYRPAPDYHGPDGFQFEASDSGAGGQSTTATVSITVRPVNDAPAAQGQAVLTDEDSPVRIILSGSDRETAYADLVFAIVAAPAHGTLRAVAHGTYEYTPSLDYHGSDGFQFTVTDTGDGTGADRDGPRTSSPAAVSIVLSPVNDAPVAQSQAVTTDEDIPVGITLSGSDRETAYADLVFAIVTAPAHGTLTAVAHGTYEYTPDAGYSGSDSFRFTIIDTGDGTGADRDGPRTSSPASVGIAVIPVTPVPMDQEVTVPEDGSVEIALGGDLAGPETPFSLVSLPGHGTLTQLSAGVYEYRPAADYHGPDGFEFAAGGVGADEIGAAGSTATVSITVRPVNDAPVAQGQSVRADQNGDSAIVLVGTDDDTPAGMLRYELVSGPAHGRVRFDASDPTDLIYTPNLGYSGRDSLSFRVRDAGDGEPGTELASDLAAVSITVLPRYTLVGQGGVKKFTFLDTSGDRVTVSLSGPGSAYVRTANGAPASAARGDISDIILTGTTGKTSLNISVAGAGAATTVGDLACPGSLRGINGKGVSLNGDVRIEGGLGTLRVGDVLAGHTISIGAPDRPGQAVALAFQRVRDLCIDSASPIKSLKATEWLDRDAQADRVAAPWLGSLAVAGDRRSGIAGDFEADLLLSGTGAAKATFGSGKVAGDLRQAAWSVTGQMGKLSVRGVVADSTIRSTGGIAALTLGASDRADFLAGVAPAAARHAASQADCVNALAEIKSFKIVGVKGAPLTYLFSDSNVSAGAVGQVSLKDVDFRNGGETFGVWAFGSIRKVKCSDSETSGTWSSPTGTVRVAYDLQVRLL